MKDLNKSNGSLVKFKLQQYETSVEESKAKFVFNRGVNQSSRPLPIEMRSEAIEQFDRETEVENVKWQQIETQANFMLHNALVLIRNKELDLAITILRNILMCHDRHIEAIRWLGHCYHRKGYNQDALVCYKEWVKCEETEESLAALAEVYYQLGNDEVAASIYVRALDLITSETPLLFDIYKNLGNIFVRAGDFESAEENYNRAYTLSPESDALLVNYGTLEIQRDNLDEALIRFRSAIEINVENDKAWVGLALVHRHFGDVELAWANLEKALDASLENKTALHLAAQWGIQDEFHTGPIRRLEEYLEKNSTDSEMSFLLARVLCACGRLVEAKLELERAIALDPMNTDAIDLQIQIRTALTQ